MRTILHSDLNNFFASVELKKFPQYSNKPVAVGGDEEIRHGIVLAKNEIAKKFFVKTGETLWQARAKCPGLIILPPHYDEYLHYSHAAREIYYRYTDKIEPFGMDEAWLDVTHSLKLWQNGEEIAEQIRLTCKKELGLTVSVGVSFNKVFAKLASDMKKPDAITVIKYEDYKTKVWPLPVGELLYVGRATQNALKKRGISTIGDLARCEPDYLASFLGKQGHMLHSFANGQDISPVESYHEESKAKSIGNGLTLPQDINNLEEIKPVLYMLADSVASRCRKNGTVASGISLHIKDCDFCSLSMQAHLSSSSAIADDFYYTALSLLQKNYLWQKPLRAVSLTAMLAQDGGQFVQLSLFDNERQKMVAALTVDKIRERFGKDSIQNAIMLTQKQKVKFESANHCSLKS